MTRITMIFEDTTDGLVDVQTEIEGFDLSSNAQALASRVNSFLGEIAQLKPSAPLAEIMDTTLPVEPKLRLVMA